MAGALPRTFGGEGSLAQRQAAAVLVVAAILTTRMPLAAGGGNRVIITRTMTAASHHQDPLATGLRNLTVSRDGLAVTNSDAKFHFWYEEAEEGTPEQKSDARQNNAIGRWFVCQYDNSREQFCGSPPPEGDVNNPNGQQGALKRIAMSSRLGPGVHTFRVRATRRSFRQAQVVACVEQGVDYCGPVTTYTFYIDVESPRITIEAVYHPPLSQSLLGTSWSGYSENNGLLDYTTAIQLYRNTKPGTDVGAPYVFGAAFREYVGSTNAMVRFAASEARIASFMCRLDDGEWLECDRQQAAQVHGAVLRSTGYSREGQLGLVYYEGVAGVSAPGSDPLWHAHALEVAAIDEAGNRGEPARVEWRIDDVPAHVRINPRTLPDGGTRRVNQRNLRFEFDSADGGLLYECRLEGGAQLGEFRPCVSPYLAQLDAQGVLQEGEVTYRFAVRAMDAAQNLGSCGEGDITDVLMSAQYVECSGYSFLADFRVPSVSVIVSMLPSLPPTAVEQVSCLGQGSGEQEQGACVFGEDTATFSFEGHVAGLRYQCQLDKEVWYECGSGLDQPQNTPAHLEGIRVSTDGPAGQESFANIPDGTHLFKVRVINEFGTVGNVQVFSWRSDVSAPVAYFVQAPPPLSAATSGTIRFRARPPADSYSCSWDGGKSYSDCSAGAVTFVAGGATETSTEPPATTLQQGTAPAAVAEWSEWFNEDHPDGATVQGGDDVEGVSCARASGDRPGAEVVAIECRTAECVPLGDRCERLYWDQTGQIFSAPCTLSGGLRCHHNEQRDGRMCLDYEIRVRCGVDSDQVMALVNAVNQFELWGDGVFLGRGSDWSVTSEVMVPRNFGLIAVHAQAFNDGTAAGVLLSIPRLGLSSSAAWRCRAFSEVGGAEGGGGDLWTTVEYDDADWTPAEVKGYNGELPWGSLYTYGYSASPQPLQHLPSAQWVWLPTPAGELPPTDIACRMERPGNDRSGGNQSYDFTLPANGDHALFVVAKDALGNEQPIPSVVRWTTDVVPPVVDLTEVPGAADGSDGESALVRVRSSQAVFAFEQSAASAPTTKQYVGSFQVTPRFRLALNGNRQEGYFCQHGSFLCNGYCRVVRECADANGVPAGACREVLRGCDDGERSSPITFTNLPHAAHELRVVAVDPAGNVGPTKAFQWLVDSRRPLVKILSHPTGYRGGLGPTGELAYPFSFAPDEAASRFFECTDVLQCKMTREGSTLSETDDGWEDCTSNPAQLCRGNMAAVIALGPHAGNGTVLAGFAAQAEALVQRSLLQPLGKRNYSSIRLEMGQRGMLYPLRPVDPTAAATPSSDEGNDLAAAAEAVNRNITRDACLAACAVRVTCAAVMYHQGHRECTQYIAGAVASGPRSWAWPREGDAELFERLAGHAPTPTTLLRLRVEGVDMTEAGSDVMGSLQSAVQGLEEDQVLQSGLAEAMASAGAPLLATVTVILRLERALLQEGYQRRVSAVLRTLVATATSTSIDFAVSAADQSVTAVADIQIAGQVDLDTAASVGSAVESSLTSGGLSDGLVAELPGEFDVVGAHQQLVIGPVFAATSTDEVSLDSLPDVVARRVEEQLSGQAVGGMGQLQATIAGLIHVEDVVTTIDTTITTYSRMLTGNPELAEESKQVVSSRQEQHRYTASAHQEFFDTLAFLTVTTRRDVFNSSVPSQSPKPAPTTDTNTSRVIVKGIAVLLDCYAYDRGISAEAASRILRDSKAATEQMQALQDKGGARFGRSAVLAVGPITAGQMFHMSVLQGPRVTGGSAAIVPFAPTRSRAVARQQKAWKHKDAPGCLDTTQCLSDGRHTFSVRAVDTHGNVGEPSSHMFDVDTRPPRVVWLARPPAITTLAQGNTVQFAFQSDEASHEGGDEASFQCGLDRGWASEPGDWELAPCNEQPVVHGVEDGRYTFRARAIDEAGNVGPVASHQFSVDGSLPVVALAGGVPGRFTKETKAIISFNSTEPGEFLCAVEAGSCVLNSSCLSDVIGEEAFAPCSTPLRVEAVSTLRPWLALTLAQQSLRGDPPTTYRLRVLARDDAGNLALDAKEVVWTVDTIAPPQAVFTGLMDTPDISASEKRVFTFSSADGDDEVSFRCRLVLKEEAPPAWRECSSPQVVQVDAGTPTFQVQTFDQAGNVGPVANASWVVDSRPPVARRLDLSRNYQQAVEFQGGQPVPAERTPGMVWVKRYLQPSDPTGPASGEMTLSQTAGGVMLLALKVQVDTPVADVHLWPPESLGPLLATMQVFPEAAGSRSFQGTTELPPAVTLQALRTAPWSLRVHTQGDNDPRLVAQFTTSYAAFFEVYPYYSLASPAPEGAVSKMQCCLDSQCASRCQHCRGTEQCSEDCSSRESQMATLCDCGSVAGWQQWPVGYNASSVASMRPGEQVPWGTWGGPGAASTQWECAEGPRLLTGLAAGRHEFAVRTIDRSLTPSSRPFFHAWVVDVEPARIGLVELPPLVTNNPQQVAVFASTKPLSAAACKRSGAAVACFDSDPDGSTVRIAGLEGGGSVVASVQGVDVAGLVALTPSSTASWTVDLELPVLTLLPPRVTADGFELGFSFSKFTPRLSCNLYASTAASGQDQAVVSRSCTSALGDHCLHVTIDGLGEEDRSALDGATGLYHLRRCGEEGASACLHNGRPIYAREVPPGGVARRLLYDGTGWVVTGAAVPAEGAAVSFLDTLLRIDSNSLSAAGLGEDMATWRSGTNGQKLPEVRSTCGYCGQSCSVLYHSGLAPGRYTMCVTAADAAGNQAELQCTAAMDVLGSASFQATAYAQEACSNRATEQAMAVGASVGYAAFTFILSWAIYYTRKQAAVRLAQRHRRAAVLTSEQAFSEAQAFSGY